MLWFLSAPGASPGSGYRKAGDPLLAASSHARAREHRRLAREAAIDEAGRANHGHGEAAQHALCRRTQKEPLEVPPPVCTHDDEIYAFVVHYPE